MKYVKLLTVSVWFVPTDLRRRVGDAKGRIDLHNLYLRRLKLLSYVNVLANFEKQDDSSLHNNETQDDSSLDGCVELGEPRSSDEGRSK